jgi:hypothetical protein
MYQAGTKVTSNAGAATVTGLGDGAYVADLISVWKF